MELSLLLEKGKAWFLVHRVAVMRYGVVSLVAVLAAGAAWFMPPLRQGVQRVWAKALPPAADTYDSGSLGVQASSMAESLSGLKEQVSQLEQVVADQKKASSQAEAAATAAQASLKEAIDAQAQDVARTRRDMAALAAGQSASPLSDSPDNTDTVNVGAPSVAAGPLNINTATADQLDALPGIGPSYAKRIVDYRDEHGDFKAIDDLDKVSGIGASTIAKIKDKVRV